MGNLTKATTSAGGVEQKFLNELLPIFQKFNEVEGIFLAGSAAHKELIWWEENDRRRLLSDVEIGVISRKLRRRKHIKEAAKEIGLRYSYDVEIFLVTPRRLRLGSPKNLSFREHPPTVLMYDLLEGADWLWKKEVFPYKRYDHIQIPLWEGGIRLILNRLGEGADVLLPWFQNQQVKEIDGLSRWVLKLLMAIGDSILIAQGKYTTGYGNRAGEWQKIARPEFLQEEQKQIILSAYMTRLGKPSDVASLDPSQVTGCTYNTLIYLLEKHGGLEFSSDYFPSTLSYWAKFFNQHPYPLRFQAPLAMLDGIYESLLLLPGLIRSPFPLHVLSTAIQYNLHSTPLC